MLCFESMIAEAGQKAGMKVPPKEMLDNEENTFSAEEYPHFACFCNLQLGRPMRNWTEHWENAKIIAKISEIEIKTLTLTDFLSRGLQYSN